MQSVSPFNILDPFSAMTLAAGPTMSSWDVTAPNAGFDGGDYGQSSTIFRPPMDLTSNPYHYLLQMDLPGMHKNELDINVQGQTLTISGRRKLAFQGMLFNKNLNIFNIKNVLL